MKRPGPILLLALLAALAVFGTLAAAAPIKGALKFCSDPTFPPMEYKTTAGKAVGFDIDLANAIAKNWKVKAKFVETGFPGLLPGLAAKRCTVVISGIFITPDRLAQFPAVAYMKTHRVPVPGDRFLRNLLPKRGNKAGHGAEDGDQDIQAERDAEEDRREASDSGDRREVGRRAGARQLRHPHLLGSAHFQAVLAWGAP